MAAAVPRYTLPSSKYFRTTLLPELYDAVSAAVTSVLDTPQHISFTTDGWTTAQCTDSLLSITAHWIDESWKQQSAVIAACRIRGSHTAANLGTLIQDNLTKWHISRDRVHVFLRDNAKNMANALRDAGLPSVPCFAHMLQLCVKRGLSSQRAITDAVSVCRALVGHFSHSTLAKDDLEKVQATVPNTPCHALIQDVQTRWNSTYLMLQRLTEQRRPLVLYAAEHDVTMPSANQVNHASHLFINSSCTYFALNVIIINYKNVYPIILQFHILKL